MHYILFIAFFGAVLLAISDRRLTLGVVAVVYSAFVLFALAVADGSWDYRGYRELYDCAVVAECRETKNIEETFWLGSRVTRSVFGDELGFFVLLGSYLVPALALKVWVMFRRAPNFAFALFAYACWFFLLLELTQIRAALAVGVAWLALYFRASGLNGAAGAALLVAVVFHNSAVAAAPLLVMRRFELNPKWQAIGLVACVVAGQALAFLFLRASLGQFASWGRLGLYLSAAGNSVLDVNLVNVSAIAVFVVYVWRTSTARRAGLEVFEGLSLKAVWLGLCFYALAYWIPGAGLRVFEFLGSFAAIVASGIYRDSRLVGRTLIVALFVLVFLNLVIKNGTRVDFILPWHPDELKDAAAAMQWRAHTR